MKRGAFAIAFAAAFTAACAQLLGIAPVHDDPADAATTSDGEAPFDASLDGTATPADGTVAESSSPALGDAGDATDAFVDTGPVVDPARGCTGPDGGPASFFPSVSTFPQGLAIDRTGIYVADLSSLRRCSIEGCDSGVTLVYPTSLDAFTANDAHLVFCASGVVTIATASGATVRTYVANNGCEAMITRGSDVYWATATSVVHVVDTPDAHTDTVLDDSYGPAIALAPTSKWLFFLDETQLDAGAARVARCDLAGCDAGLVVFGAASGGTGMLVPSIAANEETVFWGDPGSNQIFACPTSGCGGGGPVVLFADASVNSLYADETALYWSTAIPAVSTLGAVYKTFLDGGETVTLADDHRTPGHLVANERCVYWTDDGFVPSHEPGYVWGVRQP